MSHNRDRVNLRQSLAWEIVIALLICTVALLAAGCAGQAAHGGLSNSNQALSSAAPAAGGLNLAHQASGFSLSVLPESFLGSTPRGRFRLEVSVDADGVTVRVRGTGLINQRAFYARLSCPPGLRLIDAQAGTSLGAPAEVIQLCLQRQELVTLGAVLQHCDKRRGIDGAAELACARFDRGAPAGARQVSGVPSTTASHSILRVNCTQERIEWDYRLPGDYNQNGVVDAGDLTPLAVHWEEPNLLFPDSASRYATDSIQDVIDTSGDEQIGLPDLTAIGINFDAQVTGWNLYRSANAAQDFPDVDLNDPAGDGAALSKIASYASHGFNDLKQGNPAAERLRFGLDLPDLTGNMAYWARPVLAGAEGTPSNWSPYDAGLINAVVGTVDPESYYGVSSGTLDFEFSTLGAEGVDGVLWANAVDALRIVSANVRFDGAALDFVPAPEAALMRDPAGVTCALSSIYEIPGQVLVANASTYDGTKPGLAGTFPAWRLTLARAPQSGQTTPHVAGYAAGRGSRDHDVSFDGAGSDLAWYYSGLGDMNQNGITTTGDPVVLGYNYSVPGPYLIDSMMYMVDANHNGQADINDLTVTGTNFGLAVTGYNIYASPDPNVAPFNANIPGDPDIAPIGYVNLVDASGDRKTDRLHFSFHVPAAVSGTYLWVQPEYRGEIGGVMHGDCVQVP